MIDACCCAAAALGDGAEIDRARLHDHVAADVAMDLQLHFRLEGLVELHLDRGVLAAEELAGIELTTTSAVSQVFRESLVAFGAVQPQVDSTDATWTSST